jgi:hypothetical protein
LPRTVLFIAANRSTVKPAIPIFQARRRPTDIYIHEFIAAYVKRDEAGKLIAIAPLYRDESEAGPTSRSLIASPAAWGRWAGTAAAGLLTDQARPRSVTGGWHMELFPVLGVCSV